MELKIVISGFGGQGALFAGKVLANAAMAMGREVSWLPSYGPEMRGGTANCRVVISDEPICSPAAERYDALIAMNLPSLERFRAVTNGPAFTDRRFLQSCGGDARVVGIDTELCRSGAAHDGLLNMVMVGALASRTGFVSLSAVVAAIEKLASSDMAKRDIAAAQYGALLMAAKSVKYKQVI